MNRILIKSFYILCKIVDVLNAKRALHILINRLQKCGPLEVEAMARTLNAFKFKAGTDVIHFILISASSSYNFDFYQTCLY